MNPIMADKDLDLIFRSARSYSSFLDKPVSDVTLQAIYDLMRMGPTASNSSPARLLFLRSPEAKQRLLPHLQAEDRERTAKAPVTAILGYDLRFHEKLDRLCPGDPNARSQFEGDQRKRGETALRNGSLQGGYFIVAARALGLDCGPIFGFGNAGIDAEFFPDGTVKSNLLCNLGYGDPAPLPPRSPRLEFADACRIL